MVFGRLFGAFLPDTKTRMVIVSLIFTAAVHVAFELSFERTISLFAGFLAGFFGIHGSGDIFLVISAVTVAAASNTPFLFVMIVAAVGFFFLDPLSQRGGFLSNFGFAIKLVIVTVLAYVSALTLGPEVMEFVTGGGLGG